MLDDDKMWWVLLVLFVKVSFLSWPLHHWGRAQEGLHAEVRKLFRVHAFVSHDPPEAFP